MSVTKDSKRIEDIEKNWMLAKGKKELLKHLHGGRLSASEAIKANCYYCMGGYGDSKVDCNISACPLHPKMPYNPDKDKPLKVVSEEQRKAAGERFKKIRDEKASQNQF